MSLVPGHTSEGESVNYYISAKTSGTFVEGKLPLTAAEALAYVSRQGFAVIEIRDTQGRSVSLQRLKDEACCRQVSHSGRGAGAEAGN